MLVMLLTACDVYPTGTHKITGTSASGSVQSFRENDDKYCTTEASCNGYFGGSTTDWYASFQARVVPETERYHVIYIGHDAGAGYQFIYVWNWRTSTSSAVDEWRVVATDDVETYTDPLPGLNTDWVTPEGHAFVRVLNVGNFSSTSANLMEGATMAAS